MHKVKKKKIKVKLPDGSIIERTPIVEQFGNFQMVSVRYMNERYLCSEGDEYLRGAPEVWELGRKMEK